MYLKRLHIENNGPLKLLGLDLPFNPNGTPKPIILVGGNGSGKTNLLSIVADALFQAAATHYGDVFPGSSPVERPWFRVVGATTISLGATGGFAILEFEHDQKSYLFKEKGGRLSPTEASTHLPQSLRGVATWAEEGAVKEFAIDEDQAGKIFEEGVYAYFPSSRAEAPHWLNRESIPTEFDVAPKYTKRLRKPIFVEKALERFQQWLLSVLLEARLDISILSLLGGQSGEARAQIAPQIGQSFPAITILGLSNEILRRVLNDQSAHFAWLGRRAPHKLGVAGGGSLKVPSLDALSAGQSTLLGVFGTILRYADIGNRPLVASGEITGICLIDEIDAHMHVDLQHDAVPSLIQLFPKVQFIVSSHSPLLVLGMEKKFGPDGIVILDMPGGTPIEAEAYAEFGRALEVLQDTKAFSKAIAQAVGEPGKLLVLLEGETDPTYLRTAVELLGKSALLESVEFAWVGQKGSAAGESFLTGKGGLNQTLMVLRAHPEIMKRRVLLLYDNDTNKPGEDHHDLLYVRCMPTNNDNSVVSGGIENLLPARVIGGEWYNTTERKTPDGGKVVKTELRKMELCNNVCAVKRDPGDFDKFGAVLALVESLVPSISTAPSTIEGDLSQTLPTPLEPQQE